MKLPRLFQFRKSQPHEEKLSAAYQTHVQGLPTAIWSPNNYRGFSEEGYKTNVIAYEAINKMARAVASIKWKVVSGGEEIENHPVAELLRRPNPVQSGQEWWMMKISYLLISGNAFDERVVEGGRLLELWTLRPDRMKIIPADTGLPKAYEYGTGTKKTVFPADPITGESDILHIPLFHPQDDFHGLSPMQAAARAVDQHNEAMTWMQALLQNAARPSGALVTPADTNLTDAQFQRLQQEIDSRYSGAKNAGRPLLIEGGMDWKPLGLSPEDMTYIDIKDSAARDIALAFGVPPLLLGIPGDNTYSNYREARLGFYEDTVIPFAKYIISSMNNWLRPFLGDARIVPDIEAIEAVADKRRALWEMVDNSDELTVNEAREMKGLPPLADERGDMLLADLRASTRGHTATSNDGTQNNGQ
ncbi:phage portal protein [Candidatus Parcubacteria bacterium]|nr:MAG: phage portal protein [Candidatus Parcubacteria bacterium]